MSDPEIDKRKIYELHEVIVLAAPTKCTPTLPKSGCGRPNSILDEHDSISSDADAKKYIERLTKELSLAPAKIYDAIISRPIDKNVLLKIENLHKNATGADKRIWAALLNLAETRRAHGD